MRESNPAKAAESDGWTAEKVRAMRTKTPTAGLPSQSPDGDSSPEGRAFPHQEEKFFFTTKKLPHSGELASSRREMTERVIPKQKRGKVL